MSKVNDKKTVYNQMAWIVNYQPIIKEQHIHMGNQEVKDKAEVIEEENDEGRQGCEGQPVNLVLKKNYNGKPLDFPTIHKLIDEKLVKDIKHKYEWYAAYRTLDDLRLLEDLKLTSFAEQMNTWYPNAKVPCDADTLGDYATGETSKNFVLWDEESFLSDKKKSQTRKGFRKLYGLCQELKDELKEVPTLNPQKQ